MKKIYSLLLLSVFSIALNAQNRLAYLSYVFPSDSLKGFEEERIKQDALSRGFFGSEYKVFMYRAKRNFINEKYGFTGYQFKQGAPVVNNAPCVNEDFEASTVGTVTAVSGWTLTQGQNMGSCAMSGCCPSPLAPGNVFIRATPHVVTGVVNFTVPASPLGGSKVIQLNDNVVSAGEVIRMRQTFPVTSTNSLLQYAYLAVLNGAGHACCDQPFINIAFFDCLNNQLACGTTSISAPGVSCPTSTVGWITNTSGVSYNSTWQVSAVDLTAYIGSCVTIQVTVGDCDGWAHEGYCFFDAKCSSLNVTANGVQTAVPGVINSCGNPFVNLSAPAGLGPYQWTGPFLNSTNQNIVATTSGTYSLSMSSGFCASTKVFTLNILPQPSVALTASGYTACTSGNTIALNGSPSGGTYFGTGVTGNLFTPPAAPGTYSVSYLYTSPTTSCTNTSSVNISVSVCMGIETLNATNTSVKVYPNPNNGDFVIEASKEEVITITNELGQSIKTLKLNSENNYSASITNLTPGVYFVSGNTLKEKIVVTK